MLENHANISFLLSFGFIFIVFNSCFTCLCYVGRFFFFLSFSLLDCFYDYSLIPSFSSPVIIQLPLFSPSIHMPVSVLIYIFLIFCLFLYSELFWFANKDCGNLSSLSYLLASISPFHDRLSMSYVHVLARINTAYLQLLTIQEKQSKMLLACYIAFFL